MSKICENTIMVKWAVAFCYYLVLLASLVSGDYYTFDGSSNNKENPTWGKSGTTLLNHVEEAYNASYARNSPYKAGNRSNPWYLSCRFHGLNKGGEYFYTKKLSSAGATHMATYFGQFLAHEITSKVVNEAALPYTIISNPSTDRQSSCPDPFSRVVTIQNISGVVPRTFRMYPAVPINDAVVNNATSFVDGSAIYGHHASLVEALRYGHGQLLEGRDGFLPTMTDLPKGVKLPVAMEQLAFAQPTPANLTIRVAGDHRANQNAGLLALHTLFVKNHNRLAILGAQNCTSCSSDDVFMWARKRNVAMMQSIALYEYPQALGITLDSYNGYNASKRPGVASFFSAVAGRHGHAAVTDTIWRVDDNGDEIPEGHLDLADSYYNADVALVAGVEPILRGLARQVQGEVEPKLAVAMAQNLFGNAFVNGSDQFTIDIARAREMGMPGYADARAIYGLEVKRECSAVTSDKKLQKLLEELYSGDCSKCDAYVCGLAEDKYAGSKFGELFYTAIKEQYELLRDTDRFYFENTAPDGPGFTPQEITELKAVTMRSLILDNYPKMVLPADVWRVQAHEPPLHESHNLSDIVPGLFKLSWSFPTKETIRFVMAAKVTTGWIGIGFARDASSGMTAADVIMARVKSDGAHPGYVRLEDMWSTGRTRPEPDTSKGGSNNTELISYARSDGWTTVVFERPLKAGDKLDRDINTKQVQYLIYGWHAGSEDLAYHGRFDRGGIEVDWASSNAKQITFVLHKQKRQRQLHGVLMILGFVLLFPIGGLCARSLRYTFITNMGMKAALFYIHIILMVFGCVVTTASWAMATKQFKMALHNVGYAHGYMGVITMVIVYVQLVLGLVRPPNAEQPSLWRRAWDMFHPTFGRLVMMISTLNVLIGIYLYLNNWSTGFFGMWVFPVGLAVISIAWLQQILDRFEKLHISAVLCQTVQASSRMLPSDDMSTLKDSSYTMDPKGHANLTPESRMGSAGLRQLAESLGWLILNRHAEGSSSPSSTMTPQAVTDPRSPGSTV